MSDELDKWKGLYQQKKANEIDIHSLIGGFNKIEKKQRRERIFLTIVFPITIYLLIQVMPSISNPYYLGAVVLMSFAMLFLLAMTYKNRVSKIDMTQKFNNKDFIENQISALKHRILITSKYMWIYAIILVAGINVGYIEALHYFSWPVRILGHVGVSGMMLVGFYFGVKNKLKKYDKEVVPLIQQLESLQDGL